MYRDVGMSRDPKSPMLLILTDFGAQCRYYLYTWILEACNGHTLFKRAYSNTVDSKTASPRVVNPYNPSEVDRIWGIWGSYYNTPEAILYLL